jgi:hypothetical protein
MTETVVKFKMNVKESKFFANYFPVISALESNAVSCLKPGMKTGTTIVRYGGVSINVTYLEDFLCLFDLNTKKMFDYLLLILTKYNYFDEPDWETDVLFTIKDYLYMMGLEDTPSNRNRYYVVVRQSLEKLMSLRMKHSSLDSIGLVDAHGVVGVKDPFEAQSAIVAGKACFCASLRRKFVKHITESKQLIGFYGDIFKLVEQNENAYAIAKRIMHHYGQNREKPQIQNKLRVATLLECCPEIAGVGDAKKAQTSDIKKSFESALDALARTDKRTASNELIFPLLKWNYLYNGEKFSASELRKKKLRVNVWTDDVRVVFELLGFPETNGEFESALQDDNYEPFIGHKLLEYSDASNALPRAIKYIDDDQYNMFDNYSHRPEILATCLQETHI